MMMKKLTNPSKSTQQLWESVEKSSMVASSPFVEPKMEKKASFYNHNEKTQTSAEIPTFGRPKIVGVPPDMWHQSRVHLKPRSHRPECATRPAILGRLQPITARHMEGGMGARIACAMRARTSAQSEAITWPIPHKLLRSTCPS